MVDFAARREYAETLRAYFSGRITNREYEDRIPFGDHPAIDYFEYYFVWAEYDDFKTHSYSSKQLHPVGKETLKRMILFLYSDLPFDWPPCVGDRPIFFNWLTFGWAGRRHDRMKQEFDSYGSEETFPFRNNDELRNELGKTRKGLSLNLS